MRAVSGLPKCSFFHTIRYEKGRFQCVRVIKADRILSKQHQRSVKLSEPVRTKETTSPAQWRYPTFVVSYSSAPGPSPLWFRMAGRRGSGQRFLLAVQALFPDNHHDTENRSYLFHPTSPDEDNIIHAMEKEELPALLKKMQAMPGCPPAL